MDASRRFRYPEKIGGVWEGAAALYAAAEQDLYPEATLEKYTRPKVDFSDGSATERSSLALRRLEQQIEETRRQMERRLERLERRIEEVAAQSAASGHWAELQGHVDSLAETVQDLIRRATSN
ncbi:unnamed protein product [Effrenium voratum]|nr:unnamed protein product [Effrenium voratum]